MNVSFNIDFYTKKLSQILHAYLATVYNNYNANTHCFKTLVILLMCAANSTTIQCLIKVLQKHMEITTLKTTSPIEFVTTQSSSSMIQPVRPRLESHLSLPMWPHLLLIVQQHQPHSTPINMLGSRHQGLLLMVIKVLANTG